jgi:hypothetical protein
VIRARLKPWLALATIIAWPGSQLVAQPAARLAAGPFAGVQFGSPLQPLLGVGVVIPFSGDFAGTVALSTVRSTGAFHLEAGVRWPGVRDRLLTPYLGAAACLMVRVLTENLGGVENLNVCAVGLAGVELRIGWFGVFVEGAGVGVATGSSAVQVRGGLRLRGP